MIELSVDIGFGDTKYILMKDNAEIKREKFPTAIERKSIKAKSDKDVYNYGGKISYFRVGAKAVRDARVTRSMDFLIKNAPLILYHILDKNNITLDENDVLSIRTGISLLYFSQYKDEFKQAIKEFTVNGNTIKTNLKLFAQGQGILFDYLKNNNNTEEEIVILDGGYHTIDFLHFFKDRETYKPIKGNSFGADKGAYIAITELKDYLEEELKIKVTEQEANKVFKDKKILFKGEEIDLTNVINEIRAYYTDLIISDVLQDKVNLLNKVDTIVFGGGGAYFLDINELKKFHNGCVIVDEPDFANVRGYLNK